MFTSSFANGARKNGVTGVYMEAFQLSEPLGKLAGNFDNKIRAVFNLVMKEGLYKQKIFFSKQCLFKLIFVF